MGLCYKKLSVVRQVGTRKTSGRPSRAVGWVLLSRAENGSFLLVWVEGLHAVEGSRAVGRPGSDFPECVTVLLQRQSR